MSDAAVYLLGDLADVQTGPFGSQLHSSDYVDEGTPIITVEHLADDSSISHDRIPRVSVDDRARLTRYSLQLGDLVFSRVGAIDRCSYVSPEEDGWLFSGRLLRVRPDSSRVNSRFLMALLSHESSRHWIKNHAVGSTMPCLNTSILKHVPIRLPQLLEQRGIAEILDTADESIRATERLIAKLGQEKQGLLRDLLTRDTSGWRSSNADSEFDIKSGITLGPDRIPRSHPKPYLRVANVQRGRIDVSDIAALEASFTDSIDYALAAGDLLVVEGHANPWEIGRCAIVEESQAGLLYQNHLFRLRARKILPRFGLLWLNSAFAQNYWWRMCATSSGLNTINSRQLRALPVLVPHEEEQARIVDLAMGISSRLTAEQRELDKLRLLKRGLMDDLLTGRVRA